MIVIVIGMHRSGTSALSGILHKHGILMGEDRNLRPRPLPENPTGFYENVRFRRMSDRILKESDYCVKSWDPAVSVVRAGRLNRLRVRLLLSQYDRRYEAWGWKDPRSCLTLKIWLDELARLDRLHQVRLVYIYREAASVARSLVRRGNTTFEIALQLWTVYNQRALQEINRRSVPTRFIAFEDLCHQPLRTAEQLLDFLGTTCNPGTINAFIDRRLDRNSSSTAPPVVDPDVVRQAARVASELGRRRETPDVTSETRAAHV